LRFVNMLLDASGGGLSFKPWSPMSLGSWALLGFGLFSFVSFLGAVADSGWHAADPIARILRGTIGAVWNVIGTALGLFVCGYTGVLLAVSNQPVWSDGWPLGGVFLASSLTGAVALLLLLARSRRDVDAGTAVRKPRRRGPETLSSRETRPCGTGTPRARGPSVPRRRRPALLTERVSVPRRSARGWSPPRLRPVSLSMGNTSPLNSPDQRLG